MKGSHTFEMFYNYQRGNRIWKIFSSFIYNLGFSIPTDPLETKDSLVSERIKKQSHPRWGNLF